MFCFVCWIPSATVITINKSWLCFHLSIWLDFFLIEFWTRFVRISLLRHITSSWWLCKKVAKSWHLYFSDGEGGGIYPSFWDEDYDFLVRAPGLEPKSSIEEIFLLLKEISTLCLEDIRKGKTGTIKQLLTLLSGVKQWHLFSFFCVIENPFKKCF